MPAPHLVAVLIRDGVLPMELGLVHQLFGSAHATDGTPLYTVRTCATRSGPVRTDADFPVFAPHGSEILTEARTVLVPASHEQDERLATEPLPADLRAALDTARDAGARLASVCTGAFVLAAYGALDGRRATTHWLSADRLARAHPRVEVDADVLYVDEGEVLTSAGEAAGIDLCLHLIRRDHGAATAADVARRTVVPPHREGGQAQYIRRPVPEPGTASTAASRAWALDHLADPLTLADLAAQATMSIRTYTRHFRRETGQTPLRWLTQRRLDRARQYLEETDHTIDHIAGACGFGTDVSLRHHFHAALGTTPRNYRAAFRG
ncbi:helix-turn-helix domain-containing protein [Streptomyces sp. CHA1]|uniref:GlxA family transcriptional regulator n=1 Tax=Streptomyces TaxID=1883 RepID=UPI00053DBAE9|nr:MULTISPECIES: helix-turn-helix domain-containing protein [unclassified Streptomyces]WSB22462.1 helix-turn-helix domain-containing protein [Streptomyces albidoflavus]MBT3158586.1 helix-turn-helix domain-containing protein [Streptomyces sp. G11C]MCO6700778.1 helix-turn-helix domain-containing protein [Streptomyces sp. CHB9.2]MCO6706996.1 helix-turn-helix domain-containing protein [Streptomyces sp. CHA3]MCO6712731.1 helix-turn-helix domain-containing protein [Streptomyces sp. CHB19.2]